VVAQAVNLDELERIPFDLINNYVRLDLLLLDEELDTHRYNEAARAKIGIHIPGPRISMKFL
jgi:hypothetical protein